MLFPQGNCCNRGSVLDEVDIRANGAFVFPNPQAAKAYGVRVFSEPTSPRQPCVVKNALFTVAAANVTDVAVVCSEFAYLASSTDNTISAFSVDATTGAIASVGPPVAAGLSPQAIASSSDKSHLYVANSDSNDLSVFAVAPNSGALTTSQESPVAAGTKPRALSLYSSIVAHHSYQTGYSSHRVSYLYVANAGSDDLSVYGVDQSTGVLTPLSPASYATGAGPSAIAIDSNITTYPSPSFLFTANTGGSGDISAFLINTRSGGLTLIAGSPFPSGSSVSSLAVGTGNPPGGGFLYAANASGSAAAIYGYSVDPNGVLTSLAGFPFPLPSCNYIVADQTGTYLYAAVGTNIIGYMVDRDTGALGALAGFPIAVGGSVQSVSIDPTNQFLYVGNGGARTVTRFKLNEATGGLSAMPGLPFAVGKPPDFFAAF
jgi:6-phosphogluconolactonase (cycloisomerase 2 family)